MRGRTILILLIVLIVLVAIALLYEQSRKRETRPADEAFFPDLVTEEIDRIRIAPADKDTVLLVKRDGDWFVESDGGHAAEEAKIEDLLEQLPKFHADQVVSTNPENRSLFKVDSTGIRIWIWQGGETIGDFIIGKGGPAMMTTYVRPVDSDRVLQVDASLPHMVDQRTWRQERIFSLDQTNIEAYEYSSPSRGELRLVRGVDGSWMLEEPEEAPADSTRLRIPLGSFARLRTVEWADTLGPEEAGTAADTSWVRAKLADGSVHKLRVGLPTKRNRVFAQKEGQEQIFVIPLGAVNTMMPPPETFMKAPSPPPPTGE
ncbi:MAG: DUF4340 domain-containing protein [Candidatus Eisenbacteria bacterium]|nr:DUF4340 domain-containing protein [Candidatus Latescibacterota bacterium]MBD3303147.1 DUF4340 domain-containing protein [Candidatus Eisenbacteria bacterium]